MLKHLMWFGWFPVQPFHKYLIFVMLIAPLVAASAHTTSAKQIQAAKQTPVVYNLNTVSIDTKPLETAAVIDPNLTSVSKEILKETFTDKSQSVPSFLTVATQPQLSKSQVKEIEAWKIEDDSLLTEVPQLEKDPLAVVELAPQTIPSKSVKSDVSESQVDVVQRLKAAKSQTLASLNDSASREMLASEVIEAAIIKPIDKLKTDPTAVTVTEPLEEAQAQQDPIGSPHPIPWNWIQATQESISSKGRSGVRYYRSVPVVSPDGRYAVYSRVQLEVQPDMYNSRVSSVLFIEDRQTKKLRVVSSTSAVNDPLLKVNVSSPNSNSQGNSQGTITVFVPVSWSEKGDRFLARKFEGYLNTSDVTDRAVIWNRTNNQSHHVTPAQDEHQHEIAVLLGWNKTQPDQVLFRTGELGDEEWPVMAVSYDGTTVAATEADQPVTYGQKVKELWADPPVAYR